MDYYKNTIDLNLKGEIWKNIEEFPDYQISNLGRIKSFKIYKEGQILKQCKDSKTGYLKVDLRKNKKRRNEKVHHLVYESFYGKLNSDEIIHHLDENKENNCYKNLKNINDTEHRKMHINAKGENNNNHKLTEQDVIKIWKYLDEGILTQKEIGKIFNVRRETISLIKNKKSWLYIDK